MIFSSMHSQIKESVMTGLWFTALININLAILNLLPLIILDGGHIMVALFEIVTRRKPYKKVILALANIMVVLLIGVMVFFTFRDSIFLYDLNRLGEEEPVEQVEEASPENDTPSPESGPETESP